jgi:hypothetical protein
MNSEGSPSETVAAGYTWTPGTELTEKKSAFAKGQNNEKHSREKNDQRRKPHGFADVTRNGSGDS